MNALDGLKLVADAHSYLRTVTVGVPAQSWGVGTPCAEWTARQVLNHALLDQLAYAVAITGESWEPPSDPFHPLDRLPAAPVEELEEALAKVTEAWAGVAEDTENAPSPLGPMAPWLGAGACALNAAVHAWDIAMATGQDLPLPEELAEPLIVVAEHVVDHLRNSYGVFAPALYGPANDSRSATLLRLVGRDPHWSPAAR